MKSSKTARKKALQLQPSQCTKLASHVLKRCSLTVLWDISATDDTFWEHYVAFLPEPSAPTLSEPTLVQSRTSPPAGTNLNVGQSQLKWHVRKRERMQLHTSEFMSGLIHVPVTIHTGQLLDRNLMAICREWPHWTCTLGLVQNSFKKGVGKKQARPVNSDR